MIILSWLHLRRMIINFIKRKKAKKNVGTQINRFQKSSRVVFIEPRYPIRVPREPRGNVRAKGCTKGIVKVDWGPLTSRSVRRRNNWCGGRSIRPSTLDSMASLSEHWFFFHSIPTEQRRSSPQTDAIFGRPKICNETWTSRRGRCGCWASASSSRRFVFHGAISVAIDRCRSEFSLDCRRFP